MGFSSVFVNNNNNAAYLCLQQQQQVRNISHNNNNNNNNTQAGCANGTTNAYLTFFTFLTLFNNFVCISMVVSLELVYVAQ
jgi:hypothetical protein